ncbi:uncharacterized protein METZ01_LOCUS244034, partial [marine metagenome]
MARISTDESSRVYRMFLRRIHRWTQRQIDWLEGPDAAEDTFTSFFK